MEKPLSESLTKTFYDAFCIGSVQEVRAKVNLINAAPDMLKALRMIKEEIDVPDGTLKEIKIFNLCKEAISKAEGKS